MRYVRIVALLLAIAGSTVVWFAPLYSGTEVSTSADGKVTESHRHKTVPEVNGPALTLAVILVPVALAGLPLLVSRLKIPCAVVLLILSCLGSMTVGMFYFPATVFLFLPERRRSEASDAVPQD